MLFIFIIGYVWAWMETKAMANPLMATSFYYEKMDVMLAYGSIIYATYFVASFPIYYFLDETPDKTWSLPQTIGAACVASMVTFYLLELSAHLIGKL
jgi:cycloeucalenol cycloisomerase